MAVDGGEVGEVIETAWNIVVVSWEMVLAVGAWVCIYYLLRGAMDAGEQTEKNEKEGRTSRTRTPRPKTPPPPTPPPGGTEPLEETKARYRREGRAWIEPPKGQE